MVKTCEKCEGYGCRACGKTGKVILCDRCGESVHNGRSWGTNGVYDRHVWCTDEEREASCAK